MPVNQDVAAKIGNEIFPEATRLINESFGFYHVGIFLIDSAREYAVLQAANSEGGKRMLARPRFSYAPRR